MLPFADSLRVELFHPAAPNFTDQRLWRSSAPPMREFIWQVQRGASAKQAPHPRAPGRCSPLAALDPAPNLSMKRHTSPACLGSRDADQCFVFVWKGWFRFPSFSLRACFLSPASSEIPLGCSYATFVCDQSLGWSNRDID